MYKCIFCLISNDESCTATACADNHLYESRMSQFKCKYVHRCSHFSPGPVGKTHTRINLECNKRTRGINVSDNVC